MRVVTSKNSPTYVKEVCAIFLLYRQFSSISVNIRDISTWGKVSFCAYNDFLYKGFVVLSHLKYFSNQFFCLPQWYSHPLPILTLNLKK